MSKVFGLKSKNGVAVVVAEDAEVAFAILKAVEQRDGITPPCLSDGIGPEDLVEIPTTGTSVPIYHRNPELF